MRDILEYLHNKIGMSKSTTSTISLLCSCTSLDGSELYLFEFLKVSMNVHNIKSNSHPGQVFMFL